MPYGLVTLMFEGITLPLRVGESIRKSQSGRPPLPLPVQGEHEQFDATGLPLAF
jgi:hypothetical protein